MSRLLVLVVTTFVLLVAAGSASAAIVINEIESDDPVLADYVELYNTGAGTVNIGTYVVKDSNNGNSYTIPVNTMIAGNGYYVAEVAGSFGLGAGDAARLFAPGDLVNPIDSYTWTSHAAATYGRCPDGTGPITWTVTGTKGAANACPTAASLWPGDAGVQNASAFDFGTNLSGVTYQPSGTAAPGVLWAVRNGPPTLYRLVKSGATWVPDTANGWANGKTLFFAGAAGVPDTEGVTLAGGDATGIYASIERDDSGGAASTTSRPGVLRFDTTTAGATLSATTEWNLTADLPGLDANEGLEAVTWVPDDALVAKGFVDENTAAAYDPATYPGHGAGLFFVGVEQGGQVVAYALTTGGTYTRVAAFASGFPAVMDLAYEPETKLLWVACDNSCDGQTHTFDVDGGGHFAATAAYARPAGMPNLNNEGFTIAPQAECVNGLKPVFYTDDTNDGAIALRTAQLHCTVLPPVTTPPVTTTTTPILAPAPPVVALIPPVVKPAPDRTKPVVSGLHLTRASVKLKLSEKAKVTLTIARKKGTRYVTVKAFTVSLAAGTRTVSFKGHVKSSDLRRTGLRLSIVATDAAGNRSKATTKTFPR